MVDIFFILSGFVIAHAYYAKSLSGLTILKLRALRLFPLYLITTLLALLARYQIPPDPYQFFTNITMFPLFFGEKYYNGPAWSISFELLVPAILGLIYIYVAKARISIVMIILLAVVIPFSLVYNASSELQFGFRSVIGISMGVVAKLAYDRISKSSELFNKLPSWTASFCMMLAIVSIIGTGVPGIEPPIRSFFVFSCYTASFFAVLLSAIASERRKIPFFPVNNMAFDYLGKISFSVYLLHSPIFIIFLQLSGDSAEGSVLLKSLYVLIVLIAATITYEFFEMPVTAKLKRMASQKRHP